MQARASLSRHVKSQVRKFMQTYSEQVNSWWYAVKTQDIWNPRHSQDVKLDITADEHISKTSRPTGNRAWRRDHLCTTSMIENVSSVRFRHTWIVFFVFFCLILCQLHSVFCFDHFGNVEVMFFGFYMSKKDRLQSVPVSHFPTPATRNWDRFSQAALDVQPLLWFSTCFYTYSHIDVTWCNAIAKRSKSVRTPTATDFVWSIHLVCSFLAPSTVLT